MALVECEHVAAAIMARWNASAPSVLIPGGLWYGRVRENAIAPYVRMKISVAKHTRYSTAFTREFAVNLSVWSDTGPLGDGARVNELLGQLMRRENLSVPEATRVVDVRPQSATLDVEPSTRNANDVMLTVQEYAVKIQGVVT